MYQWQLVSLDLHGMEIPERLERDMTQTELNISGIIIKANQLKGGSTYRLKVDVNQVNEPSGIAAYQFRINAPPQLGQCTVTPKTGEALKIKFNFKCSGWEVRKWGERKWSRQGKHIQIQRFFSPISSGHFPFPLPVLNTSKFRREDFITLILISYM